MGVNNKRLGTEFERKACEVLACKGYWVHFIVPDARGAQPFDIIAVKEGKALAIDCKTCVADIFNISRLEDNQMMAFEKWIRCGNRVPIILVEHKGDIYSIPYDILKERKKIRLDRKEWWLEDFYSWSIDNWG